MTRRGKVTPVEPDLAIHPVHSVEITVRQIFASKRENQEVSVEARWNWIQAAHLLHRLKSGDHGQLKSFMNTNYTPCGTSEWPSLRVVTDTIDWSNYQAYRVYPFFAGDNSCLGVCDKYRKVISD